MTTKTQIIRHESYPDSGTIVIFDVYAGDDPRDYASENFKPMVKVKSFRTLDEAAAFALSIENAPAGDTINPAAGQSGVPGGDYRPN